MISVEEKLLIISSNSVVCHRAAEVTAEQQRGQNNHEESEKSPASFLSDSRVIRVLSTCGASSLLTAAHKPKAELKITKSPVGGRVTLSCSVKPSSSGWSFFWFRGEKPSKLLRTQDADFLSNGQIRVSQGGVYRCRGGRGEPVYHTDFSDPVTTNEPVLRVSPWWLSPGASVTLSCEVEHVSAGWSFYWYKAVPDLSHKSGSYSYELLPASSNGTADNSYIIHGQTHTAGYVCRAGRGEPHFYTLYSQPHFVWSGDLHPSASLSVSPDRVQHFTSDSVSLSCEGNSAEWRVSRFLLPDFLSFCSDWGTMNGSTCHVQKIQSSNAVYWCESGSAFSNAVNITGHYDDELLLLSPVHPVTEGHSVTLGCKLRTENLLSKVFFYQNDTIIQSESRVEMIIPAVSKSHEGFYKCQSSGKESPQSWLAVTSTSRPDSSSFPVLVVALTSVVLVIFLFMMWFLYKRSRDSDIISSSQDNNQSSAADHREAQHRNDSMLLHGPEEIQTDPEDENKGESRKVTYSSIKLKTITKKKKRQKAAEETVYSDVKTGASADGSQLYAQIMKKNKDPQSQQHPSM